MLFVLLQIMFQQSSQSSNMTGSSFPRAHKPWWVGHHANVFCWGKNSSHNPHSNCLHWKTVLRITTTPSMICEVLYLPCVLHCVMVWYTVYTLRLYLMSYTVLWCDVLYIPYVLYCVMVWCTTVCTLCPTLCYGVMYCMYLVSYTVLWCYVLYIPCVLHCVMVWCTVRTLCPTLCYEVMYCTYLVSYTVMYCMYLVSYTVLWCDVLYVPQKAKTKHIQVIWVQQEAGGLQVATTIYTNLVVWSLLQLLPNNHHNTQLHFQSSTCGTIMPQNAICYILNDL